jgi:hypothetical protein
MNMSTDTFTNEQIADRLRDSLDRLQRDVQRVEIWAEALSAFVQPIPEYEMLADFQLPPPRERPQEEPEKGRSTPLRKGDSQNRSAGRRPLLFDPCERIAARPLKPINYFVFSKVYVPSLWAVRHPYFMSDQP